MKQPKDYIIFPLDVPSAEEALTWVELLGDRVGLFKIGLELFIRSGPAMVRTIGETGGAGVFLDLKLHDIPNTVYRAMGGIADLGVKFVTVHCGESPRMLQAAVEGSRGEVDVLGVTVLTSVSPDDIKTLGYRQEFYKDMGTLILKKAAMARDAGCAGVVCSGLEALAIKSRFGPDFITVTPGIRPRWSLGRKDDQQRVVTPAGAVRNGADYLVIGRPIRDADQPEQAVRLIADEVRDAVRPQLR
jgi:orotidine-5'-phosphate decarboxylase